MSDLEPLGLSAMQWRFLGDPQAYVDAAADFGRKLVPESSSRQFATAADILGRLNGSHGRRARKGVLLADDVGLGKTTVAALVAWIVASAGGKRTVRILAPNDVMMRRWHEELLSHVETLSRRARHLDVRGKRVKVGKVGRLPSGSIQVVKHSYAAQTANLTCDLLIVDEAHRAKGKNTAFSQALKRHKRAAKRLLFLTATPFSIQIDELLLMLSLVGGQEAQKPVRQFSAQLDALYSKSTARKAETVAEKLAGRANAAIDALSEYVIRHGVEDLPRERCAFGSCENWGVGVPAATLEETEIMLRMDRALRLAKWAGSEAPKITNDPRFHVGWGHLDRRREQLRQSNSSAAPPVAELVAGHLEGIDGGRERVGAHSKIKAVAEAIRETCAKGEKVLVFCHHHATAREFARHLACVLPRKRRQRMPVREVWCKAWTTVLRRRDQEKRERRLLDTFVWWLCTDMFRIQVWNWVEEQGLTEPRLVQALRKGRARHGNGPDTIAEAARELFSALVRSKSSVGVLRAARKRPEILPGCTSRRGVLALCDPGDGGDAGEEDVSLFVHKQQPDTVISLFNSPFGPDVLVVTDRLSEGVDLHRYCRHLVHYELDPSPIRTVQRNGRLRRVNSWASALGKPLRYAYPAFGGTRDHRLVQIMKKRIDSFSLLLGGVQDIEVESVTDYDEEWRSEVVNLARARIRAKDGRLKARGFSGETVAGRRSLRNVL